MSDIRQLFPMLEGYILGEPINQHHGVCCYPAMAVGTEDKYIVKIISVPANPAQTEALLLTGAYRSQEDVLAYFRDIADGIMQEVKILHSLSEQEGFISYIASAMVQNEDGSGFTLCLLSHYTATLEKQLSRATLTHADALNLGMDICSALSVCRRSGYLYVDLHPGNIYVTEGKICRIGDLGFVPIDSLGYASLSEKYISQYTPPEIKDAFSALNATMDVYALGVMLYQAYNNGFLPFNTAAKPGDSLLPPANADEQMSEIILKACAVDPLERWQDPMEMGQALITYMQQNGADDTPITPVKAAPVSENTSFQLTEDADGNLQFLTDMAQLKADLESTADYDTISKEVSDILNYADSLAEMAVPESVTVPEHIEVVVPIPESAAKPTETPVEDEPAKLQNDGNEVPEDEDLPLAENMDGINPNCRKNKLTFAVAAIVILAVLVCGYFFYSNYYILNINALEIFGDGDTLTVTVHSDADESLLSVICLDVYGNHFSAEVENGKAFFTNLIPNTAYTVQVSVSGLHHLAGETKGSYSTPPRATITQFDAITGITDGSVFLSFTVEGPDSKEWTVEYWTDGEEIRTKTFDSHIVPINDLTVGKTYTFRLLSGKEITITGTTQITYTTKKMIQAENLEVISCMDNSLTVVWTAPEGTTVEQWSIVCYASDYSYTDTIVTSDTSAKFYPVDHTKSYRIEVKAVGMSVSQMITIPANSVTLTGLQADTTNPDKILLTWNTSIPVPQSGWNLYYTVAGVDAAQCIVCTENTAEIPKLIPGATYHIWLEDMNGNLILGSRAQIKVN